MANKSNMTLQKGRKRVRMRSRILLLVLLVAIIQLLTSFAVLVFGGEFRYLKEYSYRSLVEKTESRAAYFRSELHEKPVVVQKYAKQLNSTVDNILSERGLSVADIKKDKELDCNIIESSADIVSSLLQNAKADDAYLILDTGELYEDESGDSAMAALYLHKNSDPDSENGELQMMIGSESAAGSLGFIRDTDCPQYFIPDTANISEADFYFTALQTARENGDVPQNDLGHFGKFSRVSPDAEPSMKYSLPLIHEDGTVYGVLGIGLAENTVFSSVISNNVQNDTVCYVLGYSNSEGRYDILVRSGASDSILPRSTSSLHIKSTDGEDVYRFDMVTDIELFGSVQDMELYSDNSPYAGEKWALISVANRSDMLWPLLFQQRMLMTAVMLSLIVVIIAAVLGSGIIVKPLTELSSRIKDSKKYNEVVRFKSSKIYEIDEITDAVTQMQINVHGFSSQVSKMISIADVGLGTFMYDRTDDSVFVGQSLINVLKLDLPQGEDIVMKRGEFLNSIKNPEVRAPIADGLEIFGGEMRKDFSKDYEINKLNGGKLWMRLGFTYSPNTAVGIVQDITYAIMEKNRIEYERDYDHLTGLLNRSAYYRRVENLFRSKDELKITAFIMVDLDNLKYVNDTYGHNFGDDYIKTAANALKKFQASGGIVSRLSGDEFSICLPGFSSKEEARNVISDVRGELLRGSCLLADGTHFKVSGSMGVSWYPDDSDSRELLMKYADFAMYTIKHSTKGSIAEFDFEIYSTDSLLLTGVEEMNRIIEEESVRYAFQSIVSAKTGEIYGYEALMRVQSDIFKSPLELLRTAKTGAKLYEIERLTLTRSLADFQSLIDSGKIEKTAHVFINSIANNKLQPDVEEALKKQYSKISDRVVLEILESESSDEECTAHKAKCVHEWGGQLALDDFGTGYNSEYALLNIRPDIIKIDRSIISGCDKDFDRRMIIENLVKLSRSKGILVLAEGVETLEELETVISCGVDLMQGFYLARPLFEPEPLPKEITDTIRRLANYQGLE